MQITGETESNYHQRVLSLNEAAAFLKVHPNTMRTLVQRGVIPGGKVGRCWRFLQADLVALLRCGYRSAE
jgi:excisionase family DNA binding protein